MITPLDSQDTYGFNLSNQALMHEFCLLTLLELLIYYNMIISLIDVGSTTQSLMLGNESLDICWWFDNWSKSG